MEGIAARLAVFTFLGVLVGFAYANSLHNGFALDDEQIIKLNPLIKRIEYLPQLLVSDYWAGGRDPEHATHVQSGRYRPFLLLTYALQYWWSGLDPAPYHAVNMVIHLGVTWLLYKLAIQLSLPVWSALAAATLFALHPLHTEPVAMLVGRAELLMSFGMLAALLWALQGRRWLSLAAFGGALLSKEQAMMFPLVLALYHVCFGQPSATQQITGTLKPIMHRYGWYVLVLGAYLLLRTVLFGKVIESHLNFVHDPVSYLPKFSRLLTLIKIAGLYLWLCVWPANLSADYSYNSLPPETSLLAPAVLMALLAWGTLLCLALLLFSKGERRPAFFVGFTILTFLPGSNFVLPAGTPMAERLFYLPSAGLCLLTGMGVQAAAQTLSAARLSRSALAPLLRIGAVVLFGTIAIGLLGRTVERNSEWMSTETIARAVLRVFPENAKAHAWVGAAAIGRNQWAEAIHHYQEALRIYPDFELDEPTIAANLGLALVEAGRFSEGLQKIERAVAREPNWSKLRALVGLAYARQQRYEEAETAFRKAIELSPGNDQAHYGLSFILLEGGHYEAALQEAESAIQWKADYIEPRYVRARALEALERTGEALEEYERLLYLPQAPGDVAERLYRLRARLKASG